LVRAPDSFWPLHNVPKSLLLIGVIAQMGMNLKQKMTVAIIDLFILAQLSYSIYRGQQHPEEMVVIFLKTFIPLVIATLIIGRIVIRKLRTKEQVSLEQKEEQFLS
jgi:hypothetical protein